MNDKWIKAAIILGSDPTAVVPCPADEKHGNLSVTDYYVAGAVVYERELECPECRERNILRMTYSASAEPSQ